MMASRKQKELFVRRSAYRRRKRNRNEQLGDNEDQHSSENDSDQFSSPSSKKAAHDSSSEGADSSTDEEEPNHSSSNSDEEQGPVGEEIFNADPNQDDDTDNNDDVIDPTDDALQLPPNQEGDSDASTNEEVLHHSSSNSEGDSDAENVEGVDDGRSESGSDSYDPSESEHSEQVESDESVTEDSDDEELEDPNDHQPLYDGALITLRQSSLAILSFALSHNLSKTCIDDLLSLITLHCGLNNQSHKSIHLFKKYFNMLGKDHNVRHYYCSVCQIPLPTKISQCNTCEGKHEVSFFIECPILPQLQNMFLRPGFYESLSFKQTRVKKNDNNFEDIYDGTIYNRLTDAGFLSNPDNMSFTLYFDGVAIFKSAKFSLWPCFLSINELSYKNRTKKENVILAGLWFGKCKPNVNLFLQPLKNHMDVFKAEGVDFKLPNGQSVKVKGCVLCGVADLPAKALFMRMIQFNGLHSCMHCMSSGARFDLGRTTVQVYPYSRNLQPRVMEEMQRFAQLAIVARQTDPKACVYGVKGPTLLSGLLPDMVNCMAVDVMHGVYLGLMKTLLELWFSSEHSNSAFSISALVDVVDARLKQIKPPFSYQRIPRSIQKELALFKASDLKIFFHYFSVIVLYGILPDVYWEHHCKIVAAVSLLSQDSVSSDQIKTAEELLHLYTADFEHLYGLRYVGLNVHQLLHLGDVVRNLGPSWVYSCFVYESLNGELSKLVHGTRHAALQISASSTILMRLPVLVSEMNECNAKNLCLKFMNAGKRKLKMLEMIDHETYVLGKYELCNPVPDYVSKVLQDDLDIVNGRLSYFLRLKKKANVFCSEMYQRSQRKLSCFVEIFHGGIPHLCKIKAFVRWSSCNQNCPVLCINCNRKFVCIVSLYERIPWRIHELDGHVPIAYLNKVTSADKVFAVTVDSIRSACLYVPIDQEEYMCLPLNSLEIE